MQSQTGRRRCVAAGGVDAADGVSAVGAVEGTVAADAVGGRGEVGRGSCGRDVDGASPVALCREHLLEAYEYVVGEVGLTDVLPGPCPACASRLGVRYPSGWLCAVCEWRFGDRPDHDVLSVRVDVVYYLRWRDQVKIGTSMNPRSRLSQLRFDELLAFERGGRALEQRRHAQFAAQRLGGEWFAFDGPLAEHVQRLVEADGDPWQTHRRWRSEASALAEQA